jgi:hypothetical protein
VSRTVIDQFRLATITTTRQSTAMVRKAILFIFVMLSPSFLIFSENIGISLTINADRMMANAGMNQQL